MELSGINSKSSGDDSQSGLNNQEMGDLKLSSIPLEQSGNNHPKTTKTIIPQLAYENSTLVP